MPARDPVSMAKRGQQGPKLVKLGLAIAQTNVQCISRQAASRSPYTPVSLAALLAGSGVAACPAVMDCLRPRSCHSNLIKIADSQHEQHLIDILTYSYVLS